MDDVARLLQCDCSLVLISSCCAIDAWFLSTKLLLLSVCLRFLLLLFLCRSVLLLPLLSADTYDLSFDDFEISISVGVSSFSTRSYFWGCLGLNFNWWNFFCFRCLSGRSRIFRFAFSTLSRNLSNFKAKYSAFLLWLPLLLNPCCLSWLLL